jgi:hypothetical protein
MRVFAIGAQVVLAITAPRMKPKTKWTAAEATTASATYYASHAQVNYNRAQNCQGPALALPDRRQGLSAFHVGSARDAERLKWGTQMNNLTPSIGVHTAQLAP